MRQTIWRTIAFVVGIPLAYLVIWTILIIIAHASGFSISDVGTLLSVLGSVMGAIFTVGGLVVALVAILTQIQLRDRVAQVVDDAKQSVVNKFEQELRGEYEKQIKQQVEGMLAFFQATNAQDWKQAVRLTREALQKNNDLAGARTFIGLRLSNDVQAYFSYQLHPSMSPFDNLGGPVTRLYSISFSYAQTYPAPPKLEAIDWLKEALQHEGDPEGKVTAALSLMYGYNDAYDLMLETLQKALTINPSLLSYFQDPDNLMMLIYACHNLTLIEEVMRTVNLRLPQLDEVQQALRDALDPKINPYALAQPFIEWYAVDFRVENSSGMPVRVRIAIADKEKLTTYAEIFRRGQSPTVIPTQATTIGIETFIPVDDFLEQLTDKEIVLITRV